MQDSISPASSSYHHLCDSYSIYLKLSFGHSLIQHKFFEHQYAKDYARQQTDEINSDQYGNKTARRKEQYWYLKDDIKINNNPTSICIHADHIALREIGDWESIMLNYSFIY